jgi:hypothetical protein
MRKPYLLALALALLAFFFGWRTQQALEAPPSAGENVARPTATGRQPGAPTPDPPPPPDTATAVAAVKNRPLFRPDRRPYTGAAGASARNFDAELARLSLIGIMAIGDDMKGIVVSKGSPNTERWEVKVGDELPGFKVKEIRTEGLTVTAESREFLLPLYAGPPTAAGDGPVRTEVTRKEPAPAQPKPAAAPAATPVPQRPVPQPGAAPSAGPAQPAPAPPQAPGYPRYTPRRR